MKDRMIKETKLMIDYFYNGRRDLAASWAACRDGVRTLRLAGAKSGANYSRAIQVLLREKSDAFRAWSHYRRRHQMLLSDLKALTNGKA
jgi:hypothetical protein